MGLEDQAEKLANDILEESTDIRHAENMEQMNAENFFRFQDPKAVTNIVGEMI